MLEAIYYLPVAILVPAGIALFFQRQHPGEDERLRRIVARSFAVVMIFIGAIWAIFINLPRF